MALIRVSGLVGILGAGILVNEEILGTSVTTKFRGEDIELTFPNSDDDFDLDDGCFANFSLFCDADGTISGREAMLPLGTDLARIKVPTFADSESPQEPDQRIAQMVKVFRVQVFVQAPFGIGDFRDGDISPEWRSALNSLSSQADDLLGSFASALMHAARLAPVHQYWIGTSSGLTALIGFRSYFDVDGDAEIPYHSTDSGSWKDVIDPQHPIDSELLDSILTMVARGEAPSLAKTILSDAHFLGRVSRPPDFRMSVVLAAVAVETYVQEVMRNVCPEGSEKLLDLLVANPRDFSMSIVSHLDKTMDALAGRSLRLENQDAWKAAIALFELRNGIAHGRSNVVTEDQAILSVGAAFDVFNWLTSVQRTGPSMMIPATT
jgi:hypothetical protein